ncbi:MAG: SatD family protein [Candidatus Methanoperedens sp.]|nr:SatD family protein [Candidatus Methanoperedens sp.]MCZ7406132.1 SatD family protein [Candidatus Methanoperedens sp.]
MKKQLCVILGDVISSRRIKDKEAFQNKLQETCNEINTLYADYIYAEFKILKGIDEIEGVLFDISKSYDITSTILEKLYPDLMRFVVVFDYIDTAAESSDVAKMDGPAFHRASDIMGELKKSKLIFSISIEDKAIENLISGEINLILLFKKNLSAKQHLIVKEYKETGSQHEVAKKLGITQQAVSKALNRALWEEIRHIEQGLNYALEH